MAINKQESYEVLQVRLAPTARSYRKHPFNLGVFFVIAQTLSLSISALGLYIFEITKCCVSRYLSPNLKLFVSEALED
jgi:hypothetical protein